MLLDKKTRFLFYLFGTLILMWPAIYNGYPLTHYDTATYLSAGFDLNTPIAHPIGYGIWIWISSFFGLTIWTTLFLQSITILFLILQVFDRMKGQPIFLFLTILVLSLFSPVAWLTSYLMPDIFTGIGILCIALTLSDLYTGRRPSPLLFFLLFCSFCVHFSHFSLFITLVGLYGLVYFVFLSEKRGAIIKWGLSVLLVAGLAVITFSASLSKSKHMYGMSRLIELGVLQDYLQENCDTKPNLLCPYKDDIPRNADDFMWNQYSPLHKIGGWMGTRDSFNKLNEEVMSSWKYKRLYLVRAFPGLLKQFYEFEIGNGIERMESEGNLNVRLQKFIRTSSQKHMDSKQNQGKLKPLVWSNRLSRIGFIGSIILIILYFTQFNKPLKALLPDVILFLMIGFIVHALLHGILGNFHPRYVNKIVWLVVLAGCLCSINSKFINRIAK